MRKLRVGDGVKFKNNPFDWAVPLGGAVYEIDGLSKWGSNQDNKPAISLKGGCMMYSQSDVELA